MSVRTIGLAASLVVFAFACGTADKRSGFTSEKNPTDPGVTTTPSDEGTIGGDGDDDDDGSKGVKTENCSINLGGSGDPNKDYDGDGFPLKNDCNECNKSINKGARDIAGDGIDQDCSGTADDEPDSCDATLGVKPGDAYEAAAAMGLCKKADGVGWGLLEAKFVQADGADIDIGTNVGVLPAFGANKPKEGKRLFVLSTGQARTPKDEGYSSLPGAGGNGGKSTGFPEGFPKESPFCKGVSGYEVSDKAFDSSGLQVKIRVPSNAKSFSYEHFFLTQEFPNYLCSKFNDFFVTMMDPKPAGLDDGNIAFDAQGNPIGVNSDLFRVCKEGDYALGGGGGGLGGIFGGGGGGANTHHYDCPDGTGPLKNTGPTYQSGGGSGWLTTNAPVEPGTEITLLFTVWDAGDANLDSSVLIDNFKWSLTTTKTVDTNPTTVK